MLQTSNPQLFEISLPLNQSENSPLVKEIEAKGLFPVSSPKNACFLISVIDVTEAGNAKAVFSYVNDFQEKRTFAYQHLTNAGQIKPNFGYLDWVRIGVVIPDILQACWSGRRSLKIIARLVDLDNPPEINAGFHVADNHPGMLWIAGIPFEHKFTEKGWEEAMAEREEALALVVKLGVSISMIDGEIDDRKGPILTAWIKRVLAVSPAHRQEPLKEVLNAALKNGYESVKASDFSLSDITNRLNKIADKKIKYDMIDLGFAIMTVNGNMNSDHLSGLRRIADALNLNLDEIERIKDQKIIKLNSGTSGSISTEELLGIDSNWNDEKVRKHLLNEFQKWNNRLNSLPDGEERVNAQKMLDLIANVRKKVA